LEQEVAEVQLLCAITKTLLMSRILISFFASAVFNIASGQNNNATFVLPTYTSAGEIKNFEKSCGYNQDLANKEIIISLPAEREVDIIKKILSYTGLPLNFQIFSANIHNAAALIIGEDRIILYDPSLLKTIDNTSQTYWTSISILAHEIGHHLSGHTLSKNSNLLKKEVEADKFSGFVLYKMGASLEQSIAAIKLFGANFDTKTHPNKQKRVEAISNGWNEASGYRYEGAVPPPPNDDFPVEYLYTPDVFFEEDEDEKDFLKSEYYKRHKNEIDDPTIHKGTILEVTDKHNAPWGETTALLILVEDVIRINKRSKELVYNGDFKQGEKVWIVYSHPTIKCGMIQYYAFNKLLKPGRRVDFSAVWEGGMHVGVHELTFVKASK
jgi:hypothetical protein